MEVFTDFIEKKFQDGGFPINRMTAVYMVEIAECHPYYTQYLAHTVWEMTEPGTEIDSNAVEAAVSRVLAREEAAFSNIWDNLTLKQKRLLSAIAGKRENEK
ncbi:MAG: hypothetical protein GY757_44540, partial [bacterium]|nr:hypothetical protein [bacterium]